MEKKNQSSIEWFDEKIQEHSLIDHVDMTIMIKIDAYMEIKNIAKQLFAHEIMNAVDGYPLGARGLDGQSYYKMVYGDDKVNN